MEKRKEQHRSDTEGDGNAHGSAHALQSEESEFPLAWGSVQLYIVQEANPMNRWTIDATQYVDSIKLQFVLENYKVLKFNKSHIKGSIFINGSIVECNVNYSANITKAMLEKQIIEALNDKLSVIERHCLAKSSLGYKQLKCTQSQNILAAKNQNHVKVLEWKEQLCVVGEQEIIEKFFSDLGISYDTVHREHFKGQESKKVSENVITTEDDSGPTDNQAYMTEKASGPKMYSEKGHTPSVAPVKTQRDIQVLGGPVQTNVASNMTQIPQANPGETDEMQETQNETDTSNTPENTKRDIAKTDANGQMAEADIKSQVAKIDEKLQMTEIDTTREMGATKECTAWKTDVDQHLLNRLGTICVKPNTGKPEWRKTTDFFDPNAFYFGWTTNKDYFVDKLKEKKVEISIHDSNGIECRLMISSQNSSEALRNIGKVISEVLLSDYESVTMKIGTTEEEVFTRMLQGSIPDAIDSEDVIVFSHKATDCLCMVGLKDDVCQLWDKLQKLVKIKDITNTAIKYGWESDFVIIKAGEDTTTLPSDIQCCVLQYHLTGNKLKRAIRLLEEESVKAEVTAKSCCLYTTVDMDMKSTTKTVVKAVEDKLVPDLKITHFDKMSTEAKKLINFLKETTSSDLKHGYVEVYHYASTGTICVIGKKARCTDFLQTVGLSLSSVQDKEFADSKHAIQKTQVAAAQGGTLPDQATTMGQSKSISLQNKPNKSDGEVLNTPRLDHQTEPVNHFDCSKEAFACLQDLNFKKYFDDTELTKCVGINLEKFPGTITGDGNYFEKVREKAAEFLKRTKQKYVKFNNRQCHKLLLNDNGSCNETVIQFLKDCVRQNKQIKKKTDFSLKVSPDGEVIVTCRDESSCSTVAKVMAKCITSHTVGADIEQLFWNQSKPDWMNKVKTFIEEKCMIILCTEDVSKDVMDTFELINNKSSEIMRLPLMVTEYLGKYGKTLVNEISREVKTQIDVVPGLGLKVVGSDGQQKKIKAKLKQAVSDLRRSIPVNETDEEIQKCRAEVDGIADRLNCCWKMQSTKVFKERQLQNCSNVAKWFDPLGTLQLMVVEGIAEDVDFDALVYLTSYSLYPLDESSDDAHYLLRRAGETFPNAVSAAVIKDGPFSLGDIYTYPIALKNIQAKSLSNIVVLSSTCSVNLSYQKLTNKVSETLSKLSKECNIIAFKASKITNYLGLKQMVQAVFEGYEQFCKGNNSAKVHVYLCCLKETVRDVTKYVNKCFKSKIGFGRKIFNETSIGFGIHDNKIKIAVETDSILQAGVDIIVNTVGKNLDLSMGAVSKEILRKAGNEIQLECRKNAENGISYGNIVVTRAYNITGKKYVIHGAVGEFELHTFQEHIKKFVKKCLYQAERLPQCTTIAFPPLGVGNLVYPRRETACAMFDAFEEFQSEVMKTNITEIKLMLYYGDKPTCLAFCEEEWRRSSNCASVPKSMKQCVKYLKPMIFDVGSLHVLLALKADMKKSPFAVEVSFVAQGRNRKTMKYASRDPETWNDQLFIYIKDNGAFSLQDGIARCLKYCEEERVTEIIIHLLTGKATLSASDQVNIINNQIQQVSKQRYLRIVYIAVDEACFANVQMGDVNQAWVETTTDLRSNCKTTIELIGENSAKLDEAEKAIKNVLSRNKQKQKPASQDLPQMSSGLKPTSMKGADGGAQPKDTNTAAHTSASMKGADGGAQPKDTNTAAHTSASMKGADGGAQPKDTNTAAHTSASMKGADGGAQPKDTNTAAHTSASMKGADGGARPKDTNTAAQVAPPSHAVPHVTGQSSSTDEGFNEDDLYDELFSRVSAVINQGIINFIRDTGDLQDWIGKVEKTQNVKISVLGNRTCEVEGSFRTISKFQDYLDQKFPSEPDKSVSEDVDLDKTNVANLTHSTVTDVAKYPYTPDKTMQYTFDMVVVKLCKGDITKVEADCIAMSNQPRLSNRHGMAMKIAQTAGAAFQNECDQSVRGTGELKVSDCRVTASGLLKNCHKVAHVYTPIYIENRDVNQDYLDQLENAMLNCFTEVDQANMRTLALPLIGSGSSKFPLELCVQQHVKVLKNFFKDFSSIKEVIYVDLNGSCLPLLHNALCQIHPNLVQYVDDNTNENAGHDDYCKMADSSKKPAKQEYDPGVDITFWRLINSKADVKVYVTCKDITANAVDAVVSPEDSSFKGEGAIAKRLKKLGGDWYRRAHNSLWKSKRIQTTFVTGGSLSCKCVMHTIVPHWNKMYSTQAGQLEKDIKKTMGDILLEVKNNGCHSVAIPLLGTSDKDNLSTPLETCCGAMSDGIQEHFSKSTTLWTSINYIDICCNGDAAVQRAFNYCLSSRSDHWQGYPETTV